MWLTDDVTHKSRTSVSHSRDFGRIIICRMPYLNMYLAWQPLLLVQGQSGCTASCTFTSTVYSHVQSLEILQVLLQYISKFQNSALALCSKVPNLCHHRLGTPVTSLLAVGSHRLIVVVNKNITSVPKNAAVQCSAVQCSAVVSLGKLTVCDSVTSECTLVLIRSSLKTKRAFVARSFLLPENR